MDYDVIESLLRLLPGLMVSLEITLLSAVIGLSLGFFAGLLLTSRSRWVRYPITVLIEVLRGFPALLILYLVYFGFPALGVTLQGFASGIVAFALAIAAYTAEIFKAAITSVPRQQLEAAQALALKRSTTTRLIVFPFVMRVVVPPLLGIIVIAFQGTSLLLVVGVPDLMANALSYGQVHFSVLPEVLIAGVLYLLVTSSLVWVENVAARRAMQLTGRNHQRAVRKKGVLAHAVS